MRNGRITDPAAGDPANGALTRPRRPANLHHERNVNPLGGVCSQRLHRGERGLILRWNGSTWSADTDPTAGTFSPLYGAATLPGATSEWAAGSNAADQALVLSHG